MALEKGESGWGKGESLYLNCPYLANFHHLVLNFWGLQMGGDKSS